LLVFNPFMHGTLIRLLLAAVAALLVLPGVASAKIIEVGQIGTPAPSCPTSPCEVISRTTAFQTRADGKRKVFAAPEAGRIVAWSITLGTPKRKQRKYFEENLGGTAQAGIVVLRQGDRRYGRVTAASPVEELRPFFGQTVQFPLAESLAIAEGDVVALTVPTWAPALALGLGEESAWRAVRPGNDCTDTENQAAQRDIGLLGRYRCVYRTARLTYSATLVTRPQRPQQETPPEATPEPRRR
jgi:hypothetical protein